MIKIRGEKPTHRIRMAIVLCLALSMCAGTLKAQEVSAGKKIFMQGCHTCHGPDGRGTPKSTLGFEPPPTFPDFTDCLATMREPDRDYKAIITDGGPARGFSEIMPAFGTQISSQQIDDVIAYLRSFCRNSSWPRGELNFPRGMVTEKAFPEDEAVITASFNAEGTAGSDWNLIYERRLGARNQIELALPFSFTKEPGNWRGGVGDAVFGYRRVFVANPHSGSIFAVQQEAIVPTGNHAKGFGSGVPVFETFASFGQVLPQRSFLQFQSGIELPARTEEVNRAAYWRLNFGKSISRGEGFGRMWTPMVELIADRELVHRAPVNWDVIPQFQVTLSRRQHVRANIGLRLPVNNAGPRTTQVLFYILWDWFDGGLREGW
jgi:mono/diheme cytochrome c family protein